MYTISPEQEKEIKAFISKLPDSIVKSQITNLFEEAFPTKRLTSEQLEKFLSYQNALPKDLNTYPQVIAQWFKNEDATKKTEDAAGTPKKEQANFAGMVADSHAHAKVEKNAGAHGEQKQEILHTLNVTDKKLAGTKADPERKAAVAEEEKPSNKKDSKTGKPEAQAKEEKAIIGRNREVSPLSKEKTEKPKVIVVDKAALKKHGK